ncbi:MAG: peptidoglycan-binding protein [Candidatus Omnitrophica bacterium]|nr:peptidoglycan-binding protein [Candidatus Omnitrophota bacterium]
MNLIKCLVLLLVLALSGCATMPKKNTANMQIQDLQAQVVEIREKVDRQNDAIASLTRELEQQKAMEKAAHPKEKTVKDNVMSDPTMTAENIQKALKNAELYSGPIDGKMGKNTKSAIMEFQRLNNLKADGIVGKRTWTLLKEFL